MFCSMATVRFPQHLGTTEADAAALRRRLSDEFHIETIVIPHADSLWLRIAAQAYNDPEEYARLGAVLGITTQS